MQYIELTNSLNSRGYFGSIGEYKNFIKPNKEGYRSYFSYDEAMMKHIQNSDEIKPGMHGKFYLPTIILDVDKGDEDWETLIGKVRKLTDRLMKDYDMEDQFQIWFSGRGFHFHLPDIFGFEPSNDLPEIVRETLSINFPEADLMPVNKRGLIRLQYTMNLKTSLYKVPIAEDEIWFSSETDIITWASEKRKIDLVKPSGYKKFPELIKFPKKNESVKGLKTFNAQPTRFVTCMQNCYNAGPVVGYRHERLLRMVAWLRLRGLPVKAAIDVIMGYMDGEGGAKEVKIVNQVYQKEYEYSCEDKVMNEFCSSGCAYYKKKNYLTEVVGASEIEMEFADFIGSEWKKNSINLAPILGMDLDEWYLMPQDVIGLIGGSGLNKTALMQNIATQLGNFAPVLYISTEFSNPLLVRRFGQVSWNMTKEEVVDYYEKRKHIKEPLSSKFKHIKFVSATPSFEGLEDLVRKYKPRVLIIDVIDDIISKGKRGTENESYVGQGIKDLGRKYNHFTFYVHHISKSSAFDEKGHPKKLTLHSGKGSSTIDQKSDIVLGIEGYQTKTDRLVRTLKGRDNPPVDLGYTVNMGTFRFARNLSVKSIVKPKLGGKKE